MDGTVYLIHFDRPIGNPANRRAMAQHYIGWAKDLDARIAEHTSGAGAKITAAALLAGRTLTVVRTWTGGRTDERRLKNRKNAPRLCPLCRCGGDGGAVQLVMAGCGGDPYAAGLVDRDDLPFD